VLQLLVVCCRPDSWKLYKTYLNAVFKVNSTRANQPSDQANGFVIRLSTNK
jgi:hypothetical protein